MKYSRKHYIATFLFLLPSVFFCAHCPAFSYPVQFTDASGKNLIVEKMPSRVVSLIPSITEILFRIGAGDSVKGITYHSTYPPETSAKEIVGGFYSPSLKAIKAIKPDVIFYSGFQKKVMERFGHGKCRLIDLETGSIADSHKNILLLGRISNKEKKAAELVAGIKNQLDTIAAKVARIPGEKRKRVIRLMGRDAVMAPGDDSFQNEMIKAAGGIPPVLGKKGNIVAITKEEWLKFNPQVIYGCGSDRDTAKKFFNRPGWKDVDAVKNGKIFYFPCDLTCRASTKTGYFVSWLSSMIYTKEFSKKEDQILQEKIFKSRKLHLDLDYVKDARISYSIMHDFQNKTLIIDFKEPLNVVSTLEGERKGLASIVNHYYPPPCWGIGHDSGLNDIRKRVCRLIGKSEKNTGFLFTGADMDNLAISRQGFKNMEVYALVTAGVKSNAVRMSKDDGRFYEPGTINIILLPNMKLTPRAMMRAIISATEAKTSALQDLDIRSSYTPLVNQATGTGTDNIVVFQGTGTRIDNAGGHSKMGELIAKAVYGGVQDAVYKQNGLVNRRNIFQRLKERRIGLFDLIISLKGVDQDDKKKLLGPLEEVLLQPRYASIIEASFALSDDYERGLVQDLTSHRLCCKAMAEAIAGEEIEDMRPLIPSDQMPLTVRISLNAILNGLIFKLKMNP